MCPLCFKDDSLKERIRALRATSPGEPCNLHLEEVGVSADRVAQIIDEVFQQNFGLTDNGDDLGTCVNELTGSDDAVTESLVRLLIDNEVVLAQDGGEPFYSNICEPRSASPAEPTRRTCSIPDSAR